MAFKSEKHYQGADGNWYWVEEVIAYRIIRECKSGKRQGVSLHDAELGNIPLWHTKQAAEDGLNGLLDYLIESAAERGKEE